MVSKMKHLDCNQIVTQAEPRIYTSEDVCVGTFGYVKIELILLNCLNGGIEVSISIYMYICIAKCYMFNRMLIVSSRWSDSNYSQLCACAPATENWQQIKCIPYITCIHQEFQQKMMRRTTCSLCVCVCLKCSWASQHLLLEDGRAEGSRT